MDAIVAAAGIDTTRGDLVSVQSLTFDRTAEQTTAAEIATQQSQDQIFQIAEYAGVALLLILVFWYIARLLKNLKMASVEVWTPVLQPVSQVAHYAPEPERIMFIEETREKESADSRVEKKEEKAPKLDIERIVKEKVQVPTAEEEQMTRLVARVAEENPASIAEIIQMWLSQDRKND